MSSSSEWPVICKLYVTDAARVSSQATADHQGLAPSQYCFLWQPHTVFGDLITFLLCRDPMEILTLGI